MFDNLDTALVQAIGFLSVFTFFVYQILFADRNPNITKSNSSKKDSKDFKTSNNKKTFKKGLFKSKQKSIEEDLNPKKSGLFGRKFDNKIVEDQPKKKGWFN